MAPWARDRRNKEIGLYLQQNMLDATVAYGMAHFTRILGWSPEELVFFFTLTHTLHSSLSILILSH